MPTDLLKRDLSGALSLAVTRRIGGPETVDVLAAIRTVDHAQCWPRSGYGRTAATPPSAKVTASKPQQAVATP